MRNLNSIKDKLRYLDRIAGSEEELYNCLDFLSKMLWVVTYYLSKYESMSSDINEFVKNVVDIFNNFATKILENKDYPQLTLLSHNEKNIVNSYLYLSTKSQSYNLKNNINLECY
jgi:hypothetical protein